MKHSWSLAHLIIMATSLLPGCSTVLSQTEEPIHSYVLDVKPPLPTNATQPRKGTILVSLPRAQPGFQTRQMAYVTREHELNYFAYHQWAAPPAHLLLPLLVQTLEQTNHWEAVVHMPSPVRGDYHLVSEHLLIQQEFTQVPSHIRIHLRLQLIRLKDFRVKGTHEFTILEQATSDDPYGGVRAAHVATTRLLQDISDWLSLCMEQQTDETC